MITLIMLQYDIDKDGHAELTTMLIDEQRDLKPDLESAASTLRDQFDWKNRLLISDLMFRIGMADGKIMSSERDALRRCASTLEVPEEDIEERLSWWSGKEPTVSHPLIPNHRTCLSCGLTWENEAMFCGECGLKLTDELVD